MLMLRAKRPEAVRINLGADAFAMVRPATAADMDRATGEIKALIAGALVSADSMAMVALVLGEEFRSVDLGDQVTYDQVTKGLVRLKLAHVCCDSWSGIGSEETGDALALSLESLALLLRDPLIAGKFSAVIEARIHVEVAEKNVSAASLNGAAAAGADIAQNADAPGSDALQAFPANGENSAPN